MVKIKHHTTEVVKCLHCRNSARLLIVGEVNNFEASSVDDQGLPYPEQGDVFQILECENCYKTTIRKYFWVDGWEGDDDRTVEYRNLYPTPEKKRAYTLPDEVKKGLDSANAVKDIDANAYGVLLRRLLEHVCIDQNANGSSLHVKLKDLADRRVIPDTLLNIAHGLKNIGNVGAHAGTGDLTANETEIMTSLCEAIVEYVYYAPSLVQQAQKLLNKVKSGT